MGGGGSEERGGGAVMQLGIHVVLSKALVCLQSGNSNFRIENLLNVAAYFWKNVLQRS